MSSFLSTDEKKALFLVALKEFRGNVSAACRVLDIGRSTVYMWAREDDDFEEQCKVVQLETTEDVLDDAEDVVKEWIGKRDKQAAQWFLTKIGKKRGYGTKVEVAHTDNFDDLEFPDEPDDVEGWEDGDIAEEKDSV